MIIYKTTNLINGKIYIGKNEKENPNYFGSGIYLCRAIQKYGMCNFKKEIIDSALTRDELNKKEKYWIKIYKSRNQEIGYNIAEGGDGGYVLQSASDNAIQTRKDKISKAGKGRIVTEETRKKISKKHIGKKLSDETKKKLSKINKGKKLSKSHKEKIGNSNKGRIVTKETRKKISIATMGKNTGKIPVNKGIPLTDDQKKKISIAVKGKLVGDKNPSFGKKWLNNGIENAYVTNEEIETYLQIGYRYGMLKKQKNKINSNMKVAVIGSREFVNYNFLKEKLDLLNDMRKITRIVSGGAKGADSLGEKYADENGIEKRIYVAKWDDLTHPDALIKVNAWQKKYDARAGFRRNKDIVDASDVILAFWDGSSPGTKNSIDYAKKVNKLVKIFYI